MSKKPKTPEQAVNDRIQRDRGGRMNHKTLEQAAEKYAEGLPLDIRTVKKSSFIAGASWREQQAASGFEGHWKEERWDRYFDRYSPQYAQSERAWQASQLSSAKLLAEKDKEIERLKMELALSKPLYSRREIESQLSQAKELIKEIGKLALTPYTLEVGLRFQYFFNENAEKIKALLGEE